MRTVVRSERGFTMIELLVALMISGILAAVVFQLILGQTRVSELQSAREEVQQNMRVSVELISSELRAMPEAGLVDWAPNRIRFQLPRSWGVLCSVPGPSTAFLAVARDPAANGPLQLPTGSGLQLRVQDAGTGEWQDAAGVSGAAVTTTPPAACTQGSEGARAFLQLTGTGFDPAWSYGSESYLFQEVEYLVQQGGGGLPGLWVYRQIGGGPLQPVAGPVDGEDGLMIEPLVVSESTGLPLTLLAGALPDPDAGQRLVGIRLAVAMINRKAEGSIVRRDTLESRVGIRNTF